MVLNNLKSDIKILEGKLESEKQMVATIIASKQQLNTNFSEYKLKIEIELNRFESLQKENKILKQINEQKQNIYQQKIRDFLQTYEEFHMNYEDLRSLTIRNDSKIKEMKQELTKLKAKYMLSVMMAAILQK